MKKILIISAAAMAAAISLAGCSAGNSSAGNSSAGGSMPGMDHGTSAGSSATREVSSEAASSNVPASVPAAGADHSAADTMFLQMMIPHHQQAVEMSNTILGKSNIDPRVTALAKKIKAEQTPEIATMTGWLNGWSEPSAMGSGGSMSGMMSGEDMNKLGSAQGAEASKLFLSQMMVHHESAVTMAKKEASYGKSANAIALAKSIVTSQEAELKDMKDLLAAL
ncbi:DUF305 domain-containing protein [Paenarthrobacter sp. Z7-10]|uniref:DUF305 domain-containing protein n=1 Tax=Paenarthrobacter sp. Z7-10 TaxID=2787635 RepID=UPI0022A9CF29|nr:DUF305 domain-containing protein [Paenarthrobacter sp. Z7-10]MCZ2403901.1 DUF305 domain-containing protein [Paenarthrobacter sp. Z7-10]